MSASQLVLAFQSDTDVVELPKFTASGRGRSQRCHQHRPCQRQWPPARLLPRRRHSRNQFLRPWQPQRRWAHLRRTQCFIAVCDAICPMANHTPLRMPMLSSKHGVAPASAMNPESDDKMQSEQGAPDVPQVQSRNQSAWQSSLVVGMWCSCRIVIAVGSVRPGAD